MNKRIEEVRKSEGLTQDEFAKRLGMSRSFINQVAVGKREVSDRTISDICREFNVSETWLRTGEGDMHVPETTFDLTEYAKSKGASEVELRIVKAYFSLPEDVRRSVMESLSDIFGKPVTVTPAKQRNVHEWTREEMHAEVDRQLDAEQREREKGTGEPSTGSPNVLGADCA